MTCLGFRFFPFLPIALSLTFTHTHTHMHTHTHILTHTCCLSFQRLTRSPSACMIGASPLFVPLLSLPPSLPLSPPLRHARPSQSRCSLGTHAPLTVVENIKSQREEWSESRAEENHRKRKGTPFSSSDLYVARLPSHISISFSPAMPSPAPLLSPLCPARRGIPRADELIVVELCAVDAARAARPPLSDQVPGRGAHGSACPCVCVCVRVCRRACKLHLAHCAAVSSADIPIVPHTPLRCPLRTVLAEHRRRPPV